MGTREFKLSPLEIIQCLIPLQIPFHYFHWDSVVTVLCWRVPNVFRIKVTGAYILFLIICFAFVQILKHWHLHNLVWSTLPVYDFGPTSTLEFLLRVWLKLWIQQTCVCEHTSHVHLPESQDWQHHPIKLHPVEGLVCSCVLCEMALEQPFYASGFPSPKLS